MNARLRHNPRHRVADRVCILVVWGLLVVPWVGPVVLSVGSSVAYYAWRRTYAEAAKRLNVHAWVAIAVNVGVHLAWRALG